MHRSNPSDHRSTSGAETSWLAAKARTLREFPGQTRRHIEDRLRDDDSAVRAGAIMGLTLAGLATLALVAWLIFLVAFIPDPDSLEQKQFEQATIAYTADGEELTRYHDKNRVWVPLDSISTHVVEALIATEDHRFYNHHGVDWKRMFGAMKRTLAGDPQGGSTITMQLARNAFPEIWDDATPIRKLREVLTAARIEDHFTKDDILEMYLNSVSFIYQSFGIEAAAHTYFQKPAHDLDPVESAVLVGMLKGPVLYNPVRNPENARERRNVVFDQLAKHGYLTATAADSLKEVETPLRFNPPSRSESIAPHFAEHVRRQLDEWAERHGYNLYTDGLRVHTTIDARLQEAAQTAAEEWGQDFQAVGAVEWSQSSMPYFSSRARDYRSFQKRVDDFAHFWASHPSLLDRFIQQTRQYQQVVDEGILEDSALTVLRADTAFVDSLKAVKEWLDVGFVALDPRTGHIRAWVGGRDFARDQYDHVALAKRQPGSTFKPFVYAAALDRGFRPTDRLPDSVFVYRDPDTGRAWRPANVGSASGQLITLKDALAYSKNTITAQLMVEVGPSRVAQMARRMGIQSELDEVPSLGLGTSPITLLEMTAAYGTLANQGRYTEPVVITRIENRDGRVLQTFSSEPRGVLSGYTAYSVLDMMRGVVEYGTGVRIRNQYGARGDLAAKTGTSQNGADGWFMLLHPHLVAGAWVGFNTPSLHFRSRYWGQGAHNALHVVGQFYRQARQVDEVYADATFEAPRGWTPPAPPDTASYDSLYYAYDDSLYRDRDARTDSLLAATDSLLYRYDGALDDDTSTSARSEDIAGDEGGEQVMEDVEDMEIRTAADSLNAQERADPITYTRVRGGEEETVEVGGTRSEQRETNRSSAPARQDTTDNEP